MIATTAGASTLGEINQQLLIEFSDELATGASCAAGQVAVSLIQASGAMRVRAAGPPPVMNQTGATPLPASDLIEAASTSGVLCRDATLPTFRYTMQMTITGGTGMFTGAAGSLEVVGMGRFLVNDPDELTFGSVSHTINGTMTTTGN